jgi:hypothetical protein
VCMGIDNAVAAVCGSGLREFMPVVRPMPLSSARRGTYIKAHDGSMQQRLDDGTFQPVCQARSCWDLTLRTSFPHQTHVHVEAGTTHPFTASDAPPCPFFFPQKTIVFCSTCVS